MSLKYTLVRSINDCRFWRGAAPYLFTEVSVKILTFNEVYVEETVVRMMFQEVSRDSR